MMPTDFMDDSDRRAPTSQGFFIAIEGLDGAGKTTLAHSLCAALKARGLDPLYVKEPTDGPWGRKIRNIAQNGRNGVSPAEELHFFVRDRAEDVAHNITPALAAGRPVVADRYIASNVAYQSALGLAQDEILAANQHFPWPDLTVLLETPVAEGLRRITAGRPDGPDLGFEKAEYLDQVKAAFDRFRGRGLHRLDARLEPEQLLFQTVRLLEESGLLTPLEIIDTHCHLSLGNFDADLEPVLFRAGLAGVKAILDVALDTDNALAVLEKAERYSGDACRRGEIRYPEVLAVVGWHPHETGRLTKEDLADLAELAARPRVVGFGEIGLDFYRDQTPRPQQLQAFEALLEVAVQVGRPVVIHSREAFAETWALLKKHQGRLAGGVIHCFTGRWAEAEKYLELGFHLSLPGVITFPKGHELLEVAARCPGDRLLVETDAPFMTPTPYRGQRNEPAHLTYHLRAVAAARGVTLAEAARLTSWNARRLFSLDRQP